MSQEMIPNPGLPSCYSNNMRLGGRAVQSEICKFLPPPQPKDPQDCMYVFARAKINSQNPQIPLLLPSSSSERQTKYMRLPLKCNKSWAAIINQVSPKSVFAFAHQPTSTCSLMLRGQKHKVCGRQTRWGRGEKVAWPDAVHQTYKTKFQKLPCTWNTLKDVLQNKHGIERGTPNVHVYRQKKCVRRAVDVQNAEEREGKAERS